MSVYQRPLVCWVNPARSAGGTAIRSECEKRLVEVVWATDRTSVTCPECLRVMAQVVLCELPMFVGLNGVVP